MARGSYVYVALRLAPFTIAGFSVKYELVTWLSRQGDLTGFVVWRLEDGTVKHRAPSVITLDDLGLAT